MTCSDGPLSAHRRRWSAADLATLQSRYPHEPAETLARELGRTKGALFAKAEGLGFIKVPRWTIAQDRRLWSLWGELPLDAIARAIGRTPTITYEHARKIGLRCGAPQGFESLSAAARRVGFTREQLRVILRRADVRIRCAMSKPGSRPHFIVVPFDVDESVAKWAKLETLEVARRRLGVSRNTLFRWLLAARASGDESVPPKPRRSNAWWRVPRETIDRIFQSRMAVFGKRRAA